VRSVATALIIAARGEIQIRERCRRGSESSLIGPPHVAGGELVD
jgi:hypothetical protein